MAPPEHVAINRIDLHDLADNQFDLRRAFILQFRKHQDVAGHPFLRRGKRLHIVSGGDGDEARHDENDGFHEVGPYLAVAWSPVKNFDRAVARSRLTSIASRFLSD